MGKRVVNNEDWFESRNPITLIRLVLGNHSKVFNFLRIKGDPCIERKLRLLACALFKPLFHTLADNLQEILVISEKYSKGLATTAELRESKKRAYKWLKGGRSWFQGNSEQ